MSSLPPLVVRMRLAAEDDLDRADGRGDFGEPRRIVNMRSARLYGVARRAKPIVNTLGSSVDAGSLGDRRRSSLLRVGVRGANLRERNTDRVAEIEVVARATRECAGRTAPETPARSTSPACTPLVIASIGKFGNMPCDTSRCFIATPLTKRARRSARCVMLSIPLIDAARRLEQLDLLVAEHLRTIVDRKLVVAGRNGRVRREHASAPHLFDVGFVELERLTSVELPLEQTQREQRRVAFVQMVELRRDSRARAAARRRPCRARSPDRGDSGCRRRRDSR